MKLKYFLPLLALGMPLLSNAVPAYPGVIGSTNPDGSVVEIRLHGDEYFSYATDAEGVNILERNSEGYWVQAMRNGAPLLNVPADIERLQQESSNLTTREGNRFARVGEDGRSLFPTQGSNRFLIVLMQYRDTKFSMEDPQAFYTRWFNEENFQHDDLNHSARDYYMAASNNIFQPTFDVSPVVTLPKTSKYYVGGNKYSLFSEAIRVSLATLDNNGFDFTPYDADNDGKIDNVYFIYAGYGQADTGDTNCIWPHKSDMSYYGLRYDGLLMTAYACSNELRGSQHYNTKDGALEGIGTFCHEFGHVLGLPDLYDPQYASNTESQIPGDWSIMCNGPYLDDSRTPPTYTAYEKWVCRWIEYEDIADGTSYTMAPLATAPRGIRLEVPTTNSNLSEYYVIENRTRTGWDSYIPGDGMLIWHIDFNSSVWDSNRVNSTAGHPRCTPVVPPNCGMRKANWPAAGLYGNVISPSFDTKLQPFNTYSNSFTPNILNIAYDNESHNLTFRYALNPEMFDGVTTSITPEYLDDANKNKGFTLHWSPVEGAVDYAVTVQRFNSAGTSSYYVDNYNDKKVGDVTTCKINESSAMMNQKHRVTVRAINADFPSTQTYSIEFTPATDCQPYGSGVDDIDMDQVVIEGGVGCVNAPAGAVVYNMSGIATGNDNLPAGIYIVRYGNIARKVIVR